MTLCTRKTPRDVLVVRRELEVMRGDLAISIALKAAKPPTNSVIMMSAIAKEPRLPRPATVQLQMPATRRAFSWWGALGWAAAAALVLIAIGLLRQNSSLQRDLASVKAQFGDQESKLQQANDILATLIDPEAKKFELVSAGSKPLPRGKAIYQRRNRGLIFLASNLPPLPREKIYALWLFPANGGALIAAMVYSWARRERQTASIVNPPLPENNRRRRILRSHWSPRAGSRRSFRLLERL